jgi:hypothetical protein
VEVVRVDEPAADSKFGIGLRIQDYTLMLSENWLAATS